MSPIEERLSEEERRGRDAVRAIPLEAPHQLRLAVDQSRQRATKRRRTFAVLAPAGSLAAAVTIVLVSGGGGGLEPALADVADLARRPATAAAPPAAAGEPRLLAASQDGVQFPNWARKLGWRAVGRRVDELNGRRITTVFYVKGGRRVAYSIVSGGPLPRPGNARRAPTQDIPVFTVADDGVRYATWERQRHTCVLSGDGVPAPALVKLATWRGDGAVKF